MSSADHESYPLSPLTGGEIDPAIEALVSRLVQLRLEDSNQQMVSQFEAWKRQEAEMLQREAIMREAMEALNAKLATANEALLRTNGEPSSSVADTGSHTTVRAASYSDDAPSPTNARKHRRRIAEPVPDTAPARNTRSNTQSSFGAPSAHSPQGPVQDSTTPIVSTIPAFESTTLIVSTIPAAESAIHNLSLDGPAVPLPLTNEATSPNRATESLGRNRTTVKTAAEVYRLLPQDLPDDLGGLQKAMSLHLRILWALLDAKDVPKNPPSQILIDFERRFYDEGQLRTSQASGPELIPRKLVQIGTAMSSAQGRIANQTRLVEEHMLTFMQSCLARFGMEAWCPDLRQSAYSLYNSACRIVALDTFKQALISHTYIHLNPNPVYATNMDILIKLYDHFVFHTMRLRYERENRRPGSVLQDLQAIPQYQARNRLAQARLAFLKENGYPRRYQDLIHVKATSNDERDPSRDVYYIKRRPERSQKAEQFFRILDKKREEQTKQNKTKKWRQRIREVPSAGQLDSPFTALPEGMPVDYFDPDFFNTLQPKTRNRIAIRKVALLPDMSQAFTWNAEERLSDSVFTRRYGADLFTKYNMVTDTEMRRMAESADDEWEAVSDDDDDMSVSDHNSNHDQDNVIGLSDHGSNIHDQDDIALSVEGTVMED